MESKWIHEKITATPPSLHRDDGENVVRDRWKLEVDADTVGYEIVLRESRDIREDSYERIVRDKNDEIKKCKKKKYKVRNMVFVISVVEDSKKEWIVARVNASYTVAFRFAKTMVDHFSHGGMVHQHVVKHQSREW